MDLKTLRLFATAAEQVSFTLAAKAFCTTPSTVSKALKALERELGLPLMVRGGPAKGLTPAGLILLQRARRIMDEVSGLQAELDQLRELRHGSLRLGFPCLGASSLCVKMLTRFQQSYPGIELSVSLLPPDVLEEQIHQGSLDLALVITTHATDPDTRLLHTEPVVAVLHESLLGPLPQGLAARALAPWRLLLFEQCRSLNASLLQACAHAGLHPHVMLVSPGASDYLLEMLAARQGFSLQPRSFMQRHPHPQLLSLEVQDLPLLWHYSLTWPRGSRPGQAAQAWLALAGQAHEPPP
ncbi:LysR family transcriptional regulator [Comamonas composti]|uniref:LysR family transcriptional regulator n=1 Tax=Comamonas composti TaxID=408558 RepID=UPI000409237D|nr:LysR family transcriptional regulator [Comamonas composti]